MKTLFFLLLLINFSLQAQKPKLIPLVFSTDSSVLWKTRPGVFIYYHDSLYISLRVETGYAMLTYNSDTDYSLIGDTMAIVKMMARSLLIRGKQVETYENRLQLKQDIIDAAFEVMLHIGEGGIETQKKRLHKLNDLRRKEYKTF